MIPTAGQFLDAVQSTPAPPSTDRPLKIATVDPAFTTGLPKVTFDGESDMSAKTYAYTCARPAAGSRVVLAPVGTGYVIIGELGTTSTVPDAVFDFVQTAAISATGAVSVTRVGSAAAYNMKSEGDTVERLILTSQGELRFGSGSAAVDARLNRASPNVMSVATGDNLAVGRVAIGTAIANSGNITTTETTVLTCSSVPFVNGRAYWVEVACLLNSSVTPASIRLHVRKTNATGTSYADWFDVSFDVPTSTNIPFYGKRLVARTAGSDLTTDIVFTLVRGATGAGNVVMAASATQVAYLMVSDAGPSTDFPNAFAVT